MRIQDGHALPTIYQRVMYLESGTKDPRSDGFADEYFYREMPADKIRNRYLKTHRVSTDGNP